MEDVRLVVLCATFLLTTSVTDSSIWKELIAPDNLMLLMARTPEQARALGPTAILDVIGLIQQYDYPAEEHNITTEDGYNIVFHRIPGSPKIAGSNAGKKAVLIYHGLLSTSAVWLLRGPDRDIPFLLADRGYDVWLGNLRGNTYGRSHRYLSTSDPRFWDFSYHEHSVYDLKSTVDYILSRTNNKRIYYIGHSMGTTMSYALLSMMPEYNEKFHLVISLSPIAHWNRGLSPIYKILVDNMVSLKDFFMSNGIYEVGSQSFIAQFVGRSLCQDSSAFQAICTAVLFSFSGNSPWQLNTTFLHQMYAYYPAGTSVRTLEHYAQNMAKGRFEAFDYGPAENLRRYHRTTPVPYDLGKVSAKVAIFYGRGDALALAENVRETASRLKNLALLREVPDPRFSHLDFIWGNDVRTLVNEEAIQVMQRY